MSWIAVFKLLLGLIQQAGPIIGIVTSLQNAINSTPGTPEHTSAVADLHSTTTPTP